MTLEQIAEATSGSVVGDAALQVSSFGIDSRELDPGGMFVAVQGERDGHHFVSDAFERGAAAALVERLPELRSFAGVQVGDTVAALADLARAARDAVGEAPVIAITGSTGKTSTKDLTAAALSVRFRVTASPGSFNNELGVPLTLLAADERTSAVVVEMGARGAGQIAALARVVRHRVGVVTTIGAAHTESFGSLDDVADAKAELLEALPADGTAVIGTGHRFVDLLRSRAAVPVLTVGAEADADVRFSDLEVDGQLRPRFTLETPWGSTCVRLEMRGGHQAANAALASAAAVSAGVPLEDAVAGLAHARGSRWRMEVERTALGVTVLNDAYNANPASMASALEALARLEITGHRWAVLGEMAELGGLSAEEHRSAGRRAAALGIDRVVAVGAPAAPIAEGAREAGCAVVEVTGADEAAALLLNEVTAGDAVLVKASRVAGLERVAEALLGHDGGPLGRAALTDADAGERQGPFERGARH